MTALSVAGRLVGPTHPCYVIAEAGVNHDGDTGVARDLIDIAANAGADAVKFQTFSADRLVTRTAPKADYQQLTTPRNESQFDMLSRLELSHQAHRDLAAYASKRNIVFLSTPFDEESADFLDSIGVPAFKIGSGELTNTPFLEHVARKRKPLILSTGMANIAEVQEAVLAVRRAGSTGFALLHCVSRYPAQPSEVNLRAMRTMQEAFGVPIGYSDHTTGCEVAWGAVALGACILEKHFTLDRRRAGPDHAASLEPKELIALVHGVRRIESSLGHGRKEPTPSEAATAAAARKSLVALSDIPAGVLLSTSSVGARRPGTGIPPSRLAEVVGRRARVRILAGSIITPEMLD